MRIALRTSPYAMFAASETAVGLHARRWWLEENSASLRRAERRLIGRLLSRQGADGSLGGLAGTIRALYALHLLQRERCQKSDRALDWLWETGLPPQLERRSSDGAVYHDLLFRMKRGDAERLDGTAGGPFVRGCSGFVKTSAGIFLATAFQRGREARVQRAIRCLDEVIETRGGLWCTPACSSNIFRAMVAHPDAQRGRGVARAVRTLARIQTPSGSWPGMPFAATFGALTHLDSREAKTQVKRALALVRRTQNRDGTWGRGPHREFTTYLVVRGLRRLEA